MNPAEEGRRCPPGSQVGSSGDSWKICLTGPAKFEGAPQVTTASGTFDPCRSARVMIQVFLVFAHGYPVLGPYIPSRKYIHR